MAASRGNVDCSSRFGLSRGAAGLDLDVLRRGQRQAEQPCERDLVDPGLLSNIYEIWEAPGRPSGVDRVHQQLRRDGICLGRKRVERLMAAQGRRALSCAAAGVAVRLVRTLWAHRRGRLQT